MTEHDKALLKERTMTRWYGGMRVHHADMVPFLRALLENPGDSTIRLVLADRIAELESRKGEEFAVLLRQEGQFVVNRPPEHLRGKCAATLAYATADKFSPRHWNKGTAVLMLAELRERHIPWCTICGGGPSMLTSLVADSAGDHSKWHCFHDFACTRNPRRVIRKKDQRKKEEARREACLQH